MQIDKAAKLGKTIFKHDAILAFLIISASALSKLHLSNYSMWFDEYASIFFSDQNYSTLWSAWMIRETNPSLFYTLLRFFRHINSVDLLFLRLVPIMGLSIFSYFVWKICKDFLSKQSAIFVLILITCSASYLYFGSLLRGYVFSAAGVAISIYGALLLLENGRQILGSALYIAGSLISIYSHSTMIIWPVIAFLSFFIIYGSRKSRSISHIKIFLVANVLVFLGSLWSIWIIYNQIYAKSSMANIGWIQDSGLIVSAWWISKSILLFSASYKIETILLFFIMSFSLFVSAVLCCRDALVRLFLLLLTLSVIAYLTINPFKPIITDKTIFWLSIFPLILIANGIAKVRVMTLKVVWLSTLVVALLINMTMYRASSLPIELWSDSLKFVRGQPNAVILLLHEPMGIVFQEACRVTFSSEEGCPVESIVIKTDWATDSWAKDQYRGKMVALQKLAETLPEGAAVFSYRHEGYDAFKYLGVQQRSEQFATKAGELSGPVAAADIQALLHKSGN